MLVEGIPAFLNSSQIGLACIGVVRFWIDHCASSGRGAATTSSTSSVSNVEIVRASASSRIDLCGNRVDALTVGIEGT